jgi:hypothetical protein
VLLFRRIDAVLTAATVSVIKKKYEKEMGMEQ